MNFMKTIPTDLKSERSTKLLVGLFMLWLLTLPFGSKVASFSVGFMTLYPNLIFGCLFVLVTYNQFKNWPKAMKWTSLYLVLWFLFGAIYLLFNGKSTMGIFHVRILGMQVLFAIIIFNATAVFGWFNCRKLLIQGLKIFLNLLVIVGLFEVMSGIHESSMQTDKLIDLEVSRIFYGPMFIFENQNDFICYVLFLLLILTVLDVSFRDSKFKILFYAVNTLFFSFVSDSTFGTIASIGIIGLVLVYQLFNHSILKKTVLLYSITAVLLIITIVQIPLFYGPIFSDYNTFSGNVRVIEKDSVGNYFLTPIKNVVPPSDLNSTFNRIVTDTIETAQLHSLTVRENLILNGIEFIKEKPILGIGPGNFFNHLEENKGLYPTGTVRSPHNFVVEVVSQYGVIGWTYFAILLYLFIDFIRKWRKEKSHQLLFVVGMFPLLGILWLMPSSYLYLDINWLFLPIMVCSSVYFSKIDFEFKETSLK